MAAHRHAVRRAPDAAGLRLRASIRSRPPRQVPWPTARAASWRPRPRSALPRAPRPAAPLPPARRPRTWSRVTGRRPPRSGRRRWRTRRAMCSPERNGPEIMLGKNVRPVSTWTLRRWIIRRAGGRRRAGAGKAAGASRLSSRGRRARTWHPRLGYRLLGRRDRSEEDHAAPGGYRDMVMPGAPSRAASAVWSSGFVCESRSARTRAR